MGDSHLGIVAQAVQLQTPGKTLVLGYLGCPRAHRRRFDESSRSHTNTVANQHRIPLLTCSQQLDVRTLFLMPHHGVLAIVGVSFSKQPARARPVRRERSARRRTYVPFPREVYFPIATSNVVCLHHDELGSGLTRARHLSHRSSVHQSAAIVTCWLE